MFTGKNHKEKHSNSKWTWKTISMGKNWNFQKIQVLGCPSPAKWIMISLPFAVILVQWKSISSGQGLLRPMFFNICLVIKGVQFGNIQQFQSAPTNSPNTPNTPELASETLFLKPLEGQNEQLGVVLVIQRREGNGCEFATFQPMHLVESRWPAGCFGTKIWVRWWKSTVMRGGWGGLGIFGIPWKWNRTFMQLFECQDT